MFCCVSIPYSSGQCFFLKVYLNNSYLIVSVSIPYSSGQCFFSGILFGKANEPFFYCFNPLFIRSVFLLRLLLQTEQQALLCFNPLFIRSVFLFHPPCRVPSPQGFFGFNPLFIRSVFLLH